MTRTEALAAVAADPAALEAVDPDQLPGLVGEAAELHARVLARLMASRAPAQHAGPEPDDGPDRLLKVEEVAKRLGVDKRWVYRHQDQLPTRKLSGGTLRVSERGLERWVEARR